MRGTLSIGLLVLAVGCSGLPEKRPSDFQVRYHSRGEHLEVSEERAVFVREGLLSAVVELHPTEDELDALYATFQEHRFLEVKPRFAPREAFCGGVAIELTAGGTHRADEGSFDAGADDFAAIVAALDAWKRTVSERAKVDLIIERDASVGRQPIAIDEPGHDATGAAYRVLPGNHRLVLFRGGRREIPLHVPPHRTTVRLSFHNDDFELEVLP